MPLRDKIKTGSFGEYESTYVGSVGSRSACTLHWPVTFGLHWHVAAVVADFLIQPLIRLSFQKNVTTPAWLILAVIVIKVPLTAVVADAVKKMESLAEAVGAWLTIFEASPSPKFETALI